jgi:hypothetical protein
MGTWAGDSGGVAWPGVVNLTKRLEIDGANLDEISCFTKDD